MSVNKLTYGGSDYDDEIEAGGELNMAHAMVGETLAIDELISPITTQSLPVRFLGSNQGANNFIFTANGKIFCGRGGAPTPAYTKNGPGLYYFGADLIGKYYLDEMHQTGPHEHAMRFLSAIRLLDKSDHHGGLYTGQTAGTVIDDVLGDVVSYSVDTDIAAIQIYGYLPYARRRNNLMLILMAIGAAIKNASDGSLRITQLSETVTGTFDESRVFYGGSVVDKIPATAVQVTEHNYLTSTETEELFNDSTTSTETVIFSEPHHSLTITGGTITASGVNFCTFTGAGAVVLSGKKYNHVTRIITVGTTPTGIDSDVVRTVPNNTLLTPNNAADVAEKLYDYLTNAQSIRQEIVVGTERPGDVVNVVNPYTRQLVEACIKSMRIQFGKTELRAVCEFLVGYIPAGATAGFTSYVVLTGSGTWTVPAGVTKIRSILCGPGTGGQGGQGGGRPAIGGSSGAGGNHGVAGNGGKILEINQVVTPGANITYNAPSGSAGTAGTAGLTSTTGTASVPALAATPTATTFGSQSSGLGRYYPSGYYEPKSGLTFGMIGTDGVDGLSGGGTSGGVETLTYDGQTWVRGYLAYVAGVPSAGGGGPAVGSNGGDASFDGSTVRSGNGANANDRGSTATHYGEGGAGGHGGGGAGGVANTAYSEIAGNGGNGGDASAGGAGVIIIYY